LSNLTFWERLVAEYVLDELVGDEVQVSHAGRLELGGANVGGGYVRVAELHLFVRHDVVQMFGDAFHQPDVGFRFGEVLQPVALGRRDEQLEKQQNGYANGPRAVALDSG